MSRDAPTTEAKVFPIVRRYRIHDRVGVGAVSGLVVGLALTEDGEQQVTVFFDEPTLWGRRNTFDPSLVHQEAPRSGGAQLGALAYRCGGCRMLAWGRVDGSCWVSEGDHAWIQVRVTPCAPKTSGDRVEASQPGSVTAAPPNDTTTPARGPEEAGASSSPGSSAERSFEDGDRVRLRKGEFWPGMPGGAMATILGADAESVKIAVDGWGGPFVTSKSNVEPAAPSLGGDDAARADAVARAVNLAPHEGYGRLLSNEVLAALHDVRREERERCIAILMDHEDDALSMSSLAREIRRTANAKVKT